MNPPASKDLNEFLSFYGNFTMKDFRTLNANRLYISHLIENRQKGKYTSKQNISTESIRETAKEMNHNNTTLKKHYLHPYIVKFYLNEKAPLIFTKHTTTKSSERILHRFLSIVSLRKFVNVGGGIRTGANDNIQNDSKRNALLAALKSQATKPRARATSNSVIWTRVTGTTGP